MRTRPLPNRHAADLSDFMEVVQATMNKPKNRKKPPLDEAGILSLAVKLIEECLELAWEIVFQGLRRVLRGSGDFSKVRMEVQDVCVVLLGTWIWARRQR